MNRRKFLSVMAVAPVVPVAGAVAGHEVETKYKDTSWTIWNEKLAGQDVEFATMQDCARASHRVRAYWRSKEFPRKVYALGFLATDEDVCDFGYDETIKSSHQAETLREAMTNTIRHVHYGLPLVLPCAPVKIEGQEYAYLDVGGIHG